MAQIPDPFTKNKESGVDFKARIEEWRQNYRKTISQSHQNDSKQTITIAIRKRPPLSALKEAVTNDDFDCFTCLNPYVFAHSEENIMGLPTGKLHNLPTSFDHTFGAEEGNMAVYDSIVRPLVKHVTENEGLSTCLAFGQTGSGKTFTQRYMQAQAAKSIFSFIASKMSACGGSKSGLKESGETKTTEEKSMGNLCVAVTFFENCGNKCFDLLGKRQQVTLREDAVGAVQVVGLTKHLARTAKEALEIIENGNKLRATHATANNPESSRSHAICSLTLMRRKQNGPGKLKAGISVAAGVGEPTVEVNTKNVSETKDESPSNAAVVSTEPAENVSSTTPASSSVEKWIEWEPCGRLRVVDLAGSERNRDLLEHTPERIAETKEINWSLGCLKECIRNLFVKETQNSRQHIPYRNSKLTLLLKEIFTSHNEIKKGVARAHSTTAECVRTQKTAFIGCIGPMRRHHLIHSKATISYAAQLKSVSDTRKGRVATEEELSKGLFQFYAEVDPKLATSSHVKSVLVEHRNARRGLFRKLEKRYRKAPKILLLASQAARSKQALSPKKWNRKQVCRFIKSIEGGKYAPYAPKLNVTGSQLFAMDKFKIIRYCGVGLATEEKAVAAEQEKEEKEGTAISKGNQETIRSLKSLRLAAEEAGDAIYRGFYKAIQAAKQAERKLAVSENKNRERHAAGTQNNVPRRNRKKKQSKKRSGGFPDFQVLT